MKKTVEEYLNQLQPHHRDFALTMLTASRSQWKVNSLQEAIDCLSCGDGCNRDWCDSIIKMLNHREYFDAPQHTPEEFDTKAKDTMQKAAEEAHKPSILPSDATERKGYEIFSGFFAYFPHAIAAVSRHSHNGSKQHNPDQPTTWDMDKSQDERDAMLRHMLEGDWEAVAWRAMSNLERELTNESIY